MNSYYVLSNCDGGRARERMLLLLRRDYKVYAVATECRLSGVVCGKYVLYNYSFSEFLKITPDDFRKTVKLKKKFQQESAGDFGDTMT